ncbi:MAG: VOC family protein [Chitinophagales bacterium]
MEYIISWFEIPTTNIQRAAKFYSEVLACEIGINEMNGSQMGFFPSKQGVVSGALVQVADQLPSESGTTVYFYIEGDLTTSLNRVEAAGGQILQPKKHIGEGIGFCAFVKDTEGNKVALHSMG